VSTPIATPADSATPTTRRVTVFELALVLGLPTAVFLAGAVRSLARPRAVHFTNGGVVSTLVMEAILVVLLLPLLRRRGWRPTQVAGAPQPLDVLRGVGVWLAAMAAFYFVWIVFALSAPTWAAAVQAQPLRGHVSAMVIVIGSVLNPVFEEFLWLGYGVSALESRLGLRRASVVSLGLRVSIHAYQGVRAIVGVLPGSAVLTWYYARTRRLWPIIVAHVIWDALGLAFLAMPHR
jgi:membrane protease YdiL (CAAX protease family)